MSTPRPRPGQRRPSAAWYALPGGLLLVALTLVGLGTAVGLFLTGGKHFVCDATADCARTPYEDGYADPAWPQWPFICAAFTATIATALFVAILVARRPTHQYASTRV
ncbi:hypothetical protein AB0N09_30960 [Streptomyces erythrochromogenes]|uniref:hypothetical protein n=1 Tax=Streptomyces erythrochromogenes TaxID=285574 RepID=UPI0034482578